MGAAVRGSTLLSLKLARGGRMRTMPKTTNSKVMERCVRQVLEHLPEYQSLTATGEYVASPCG